MGVLVTVLGVGALGLGAWFGAGSLGLGAWYVMGVLAGPGVLGQVLVHLVGLGLVGRLVVYQDV